MLYHQKAKKCKSNIYIYMYKFAFAVSLSPAVSLFLFLTLAVFHAHMCHMHWGISIKGWSEHICSTAQGVYVCIRQPTLRKFHHDQISSK